MLFSALGVWSFSAVASRLPPSVPTTPLIRQLGSTPKQVAR